MNRIVETPVGVYHFLFDRRPGGIPVVAPRPRTVNLLRKDNKALVARVKADAGLREAVEKAVSLVGGLQRVISRGDKVVVKPNFNSPDPFPASTDLEFLSAVTQMLLSAGAKVTIGDGAGGVWRPTENVFRKVGLHELGKKLGVDVAVYEDKASEWVRVKIDGDYLTTVSMPRSAYEADKFVYVPCMKTHRLATLSGAIKLAFGFVHPGERLSFHLGGNLQQKAAEVNLCWQPHLIIMDGRKSFVSGGPDKGRLAHPGLVLASGDLVATDIEGMKALIENGAQDNLPADPWKLPQIVTALKHGLGVKAGEYDVVE
jgi:uncharacterized protein (DUF362 family)